MFSNFAWSEILVIACVAIIVVGPKDLPGMLRSLGKTIGNVKRMAGDFQRQFNDAIKDAELDEITDLAKNKTIAPFQDAKDAMEEFAGTISDPLDTDIVDEIEAPAVAAQAKQAASKAKPAAKKPAPKRKAATPAKTGTKAKQTPAKSKAAPAKAPAGRKVAAGSTTRKRTTKTAAAKSDT